MYVCVCIYIYIYRERERETDKADHPERPTMTLGGFV